MTKKCFYNTKNPTDGQMVGSLFEFLVELCKILLASSLLPYYQNKNLSLSFIITVGSNKYIWCMHSGEDADKYGKYKEE